jgi:hypothetical protein
MNTEPNASISFSDPAGDHATVIAAKRGDELAFETLFRQYLSKVFAVALCYTRARDGAILAVILLLPLLVLVAQQTSPTVIEGPQGQAKVIQVQGKNYVEVDEVARITGGSLQFAGSQMILKLPGEGHASSQAVQSAPAPPVGYSRQLFRQR